MIDRKQIQQAIAAIEARRTVLGDMNTHTTVVALQELLQRTVSRQGESPRDAQRKQATVLFAKVTGFAATPMTTPETAVPTILNALWQHLDGAITQHNGIIDKHIGDAVMGVFGVPAAHEDDPAQAIRAALRMRAALSDFVSEFGQTWEQTHQQALPDLQSMRLSVGINTGPVMLDRVGDSDEYTVIGDTVNVASRLERAAPPGGILISHDTYQLVRDSFNVEALGPVPIKGRTEPIQVYLVLGVKPRLFYGVGRGVEGVETRMIGRDMELAGMKAVLQLAIDNKRGRAITISGEAGVGKSRLIHEFSVWSKTLPQEIQELKGRTYQHMRQIPYALFRDLFATFFGIQDNDTALVARQKLIQGMTHYLALSEEELQKRAVIMARLIGLDLGQSGADATVLPTLEGFSDNEDETAPQMRELAYQYVADLLVGLTAVSAALLIFLEDLHWADEGSLDLLEYLVEQCNRLPLLLIMLTRPLNESIDQDQPLARYGRLIGKSGDVQLVPLQSLSQEQSRELVLEILRKAPEIPTDLSDMIVSRSEGNPLYVEEIVKILIEDGVIVAGQDEWRVRDTQLLGVRVPPHINGVLQARLDRLSELERVTLQRAAVVGRVFWDSVVIHMNETAVISMTTAETRAALQALEKRELVFKRQLSGFAGTTAYVFKHAVLHQVVYESVLLRFRPAYHKQVGDWLAQQSGERIAEYAGLIAEHYELAGEHTAAAELYETAAQRAQQAYDPELAIDYYRKALLLLADQLHYAEWILRLQGEVGRLLYVRARFVEASQLFMSMRFIAEEDGDLSAQARSCNGLASLQREQGDYQAMLEYASQAEQVSWLIGAETELVRALLLQSEAHLLLGNLDAALSVVERALQLSDRQEEILARTRSLSLYCLVSMRHGRYDKVEQALYHLRQQLSLLLTLEEMESAAATQYSLGNLHNQLGQYEEARNYLLAAHKLFRTLDAQVEAGRTLHLLGDTARLRGNLNSAVPFYRKAISVANGIGHRHGRLQTQVDLGNTLVSLGNAEMAETILTELVSIAEEGGQMGRWRYLPQLYALLALNHLKLQEIDLALSKARQAHELAQKQGEAELCGLTWRVLGCVVAQLPSSKRSIHIDGRRYQAADCFAQSLQQFENLNGGGVASHRDLALTLWHWALFESANGQPELGERLQSRANALARPLGLAFF